MYRRWQIGAPTWHRAATEWERAGQRAPPQTFGPRVGGDTGAPPYADGGRTGRHQRCGCPLVGAEARLTSLQQRFFALQTPTRQRATRRHRGRPGIPRLLQGECRSSVPVASNARRAWHDVPSQARFLLGSQACAAICFFHSRRRRPSQCTSHVRRHSPTDGTRGGHPAVPA